MTGPELQRTQVIKGELKEELHFHINVRQSDGDGVPRNRSNRADDSYRFVPRWGVFCDPPVCGFFCARRPNDRMTAMENIWFQSALWMALALIAAIGSFFITISAALFEIVVGTVAGNTVGLPLTPWIDYIASFGARAHVSRGHRY